MCHNFHGKRALPESCTYFPFLCCLPPWNRSHLQRDFHSFREAKNQKPPQFLSYMAHTSCPHLLVFFPRLQFKKPFKTNSFNSLKNYTHFKWNPSYFSRIPFFPKVFRPRPSYFAYPEPLYYIILAVLCSAETFPFLCFSLF